MLTVPYGKDMDSVYKYMDKLVEDKRAIRCFFDEYPDDPPFDCIPIKSRSDSLLVVMVNDFPPGDIKKGESNVFIEFLEFQGMHYEYIEVTDPELQKYLK